MNSTKTWMTAQTPSAFGMPISGGHAFGASAIEGCSAVATTLVVRDRAAAATNGAVKTDRVFAQSYVPGTSAWSPPIC
ncbi:hypothetical protein [Nocardioides sp. SR21]|uniref:hypothetical protein n=1 Tax=Nocardioides sp. SR21 TaxID=2919501 RepID=UPI001FAAE57D|nr:hypothetical protein [Nocardioides sp. SR21]